MADGFVLVWRDNEKESPPEDASYPEMWDWAQEHDDLMFIAFDVKTLSLVHGADWQSGKYYNWTSPNIRNEEQSKHVQFVIAMIEGVDDHMAIVPAQSWIDAREQSFGTETLCHGMPLWVPLGMVSDDHLETAITRIIKAVVDKGGWVTNPTNNVVYEGWTPFETMHPDSHPDETEGTTGASYRVVKELWEEVKAVGGRVYFNPYAPVLFDFIVWLPGIGLVWIEHKYHNKAVSGFEFARDIRRNPFHLRRVWHFTYCQGKDGVVCIPRNLVDYSWGALRTLPKHIVQQFLCRDFADAVDKVIKPHAGAARAAVVQAIAELAPSDVTEGLTTDKSSAPLRKSASGRDKGDDPLTGMLIRQRTAPGASIVLNRWCRTFGEGVCIALGGGVRVGGHIIVEHQWTEDDRSLFDNFGQLPVSLLTPGIEKRKYVPISMEDHSMTSNLSKGVWYPFAQRKENWKLVLEQPRHLILGLLTEPMVTKELSERSSWYMLLPSGFTSKYSKGIFVKESKLADRSRGQQLTTNTKVDQMLIPDPKWPGAMSTVMLNDNFLVDKKIKPARYVLNLLDGTIYHEIMKVLRADGPVRISNPLLQTSGNRAFDANEYQGLVGDMLQTLWRVGCKSMFTSPLHFVADP